MSNRKLFQQVFGLTLVVILLGGCGDASSGPAATSLPPTATSAPATATPTPVPPTATPTAIPATATPAGMLITPIPSGIAGGWRTEPGGTLTISLFDSEGRLLALARVEGTVEWDKEGRITQGEENFLEIQTQAHLDHWYKIMNHEVRDGLLSVTAEDGVYTFFTEAYSRTPTTRAVANATISKDGKWKGQASFFITRFSGFSAVIFQDIENYEVQR